MNGIQYLKQKFGLKIEVPIYILVLHNKPMLSMKVVYFSTPSTSGKILCSTIPRESIRGKNIRASSSNE